MQCADKGLQQLGNQTLVAHVHAAISPQVDEVMVSANRNLDVYAAIATVVRDRSTGFAGPLAGIEAALEAAGDRWLASVPVDCPTPPADLIDRLADALNDNRDACCAAAHDGERVQPMFALYRSGLLDAVRRALRDNVATRQWQRDIGCVSVDFSDCADAFRNLNTQAELNAYTLASR